MLKKEEILKEAEMFLKKDTTLRELSKELNRSKSAIHYDLTKRLMIINQEKYKEVKNKLETNKQTKHIKGGESTKRKYKNTK